MADPLTIFGAVASTVQIIDVLTKAASVLDTLRAQWQSSDIALLSLTSQLAALSTALSKIQEWMESGIEEIHHQLTMDLTTALNCCEILATRVYAEIGNLQKAPSGSLLTTAKARFLFKRSGIGELQSMIDRQTAALTLLLTACNSNSLSRQQEILGASGVRKRMSRVQKDTESLRGTVDSSSYLSRSTERSSRLSMLFDFDDQLFSSRPYTAMIRKTVKLSIRSPTRRAPGPEEVITQITGNSVVPKLPSPMLKFVGKAQGRDNDQTQNSTKILLLGPGEASKTTFLKQMQWIYGPGFSSAERKTWCHAIRESFLESLDTFINLQDDNSAYNCTVLRDQMWSMLKAGAFETEVPMIQKDLKTLVEEISKIELAAISNCDSSHNLDCFPRDIERIFDPSYIPTIDDIFRVRVRTTGLDQHTFHIAEYGSCNVIDVGGERSERKKWIHVFDESPAVLIFVPLDGYDQPLFEDKNGNRMAESLMLAESLLNSRWFIESKLFLCFTKLDRFEKKIQSGLSPLTGNLNFPDYQGSLTDADECRGYIIKKCTDLFRRPGKVGVFCIDATDSEHVRDVVETVLGREQHSPRYHVFEKRADSLDVQEDEA